MLESFRVAAQLAAFQEGLSSMTLVRAASLTDSYTPSSPKWMEYSFFVLHLGSTGCESRPIDYRDIFMFSSVPLGGFLE
jgi:hypothetical protein